MYTQKYYVSLQKQVQKLAISLCVINIDTIEYMEYNILVSVIFESLVTIICYTGQSEKWHYPGPFWCASRHCSCPLTVFIYIHNKIKLYADDVLLYSSITSSSDCVQLQQDLNLLVQWADRRWHLTFWNVSFWR